MLSARSIKPVRSFSRAHNTCLENGRRLNYFVGMICVCVCVIFDLFSCMVFCKYHAPIFLQVSWVKRKGDELNLITFGRHTYSSDSRYALEYQAPNDWQLLIQYANERDEGHYECQVSAHPPLVLVVYLTVVGKYL